MGKSRDENSESKLLEQNLARIDEKQKSEEVKSIDITRAEKTSWAMNNVLTPSYMVTMVSEIDVTGQEKLRTDYKSKGMKAPSYTALVIKAATMTMKLNPEANRAILGFPFFKKLYQFQNVNISVAVEKSLPGLPGQAFATPIINPCNKSLIEITEDLQKLALCDETDSPEFRAFMNILRFVPRPFSLWMINAPYWFPKLWAKYRGCACWVNAPSKAGADFVTTTWPWPITFSFGIVKQRPFVVEGKIEVRNTMPVVMVFDRRIMGGGPASRIFSQFQSLLEDRTEDSHLHTFQVSKGV